jgi:hypothetical protein
MDQSILEKPFINEWKGWAVSEAAAWRIRVGASCQWPFGVVLCRLLGSSVCHLSLFHPVQILAEMAGGVGFLHPL